MSIGFAPEPSLSISLNGDVVGIEVCGDCVGMGVGDEIGFMVGEEVGFMVGKEDGESVGDGVGRFTSGTP